MERKGASYKITAKKAKQDPNYGAKARRPSGSNLPEREAFGGDMDNYPWMSNKGITGPRLEKRTRSNGSQFYEAQ